MYIFILRELTWAPGAPVYLGALDTAAQIERWFAREYSGDMWGFGIFLDPVTPRGLPWGPGEFVYVGASGTEPRSSNARLSQICGR